MMQPLQDYALNYKIKGPATDDIINPFTQLDTDPNFNEFELKRVLILYNPAAGGGSSCNIVSNIIIPIFHKSNISTIVYPTKCEGDLTQYLQHKSKEILSYKVDCFCVVGGDGTCHEFVNGYVTGNYKHKNIAVILINGGSGNSLCLTMNGFNDSNTKLKNYLNHILSNIKTGKKKIQWIDIIEFSQHNIKNNNKKIIAYSASQAYFGIPSAVVHWANWYIFKTIFGTLSLRYDIGAFIEMSKHKEYKLKFTFYGLKKKNNEYNKPIELIKTVEMFVAMKGKYFGKGICITPFAKLDNGYLDILILDRVESRLRLISLFLRLQKIKNNMDILCEKEISYYRCKEVLIEVLDAHNNIITDKQKLKELNLPDVGGDGEFGPCLPLRLKAMNNAIPVLFPNCKLF
eukprot:289662_1